MLDEPTNDWEHKTLPCCPPNPILINRYQLSENCVTLYILSWDGVL